MALLILVASLNITIDMHFCQGNLKSFNLFGKAKNCHELALDMAACPNHQIELTDVEDCNEEIKDCCSNKTVEIESQIENQLIDLNFLDVDLDIDIIANNNNQNFEYFKYDSTLELYRHYKPPLIDRDISILYETFLI